MQKKYSPASLKQLCEIIGKLHLISMDNSIVAYCRLENSNNLARLPLLLFILLYLTNCNLREDKAQWDKAIIDSNISKEPVYLELDKKSEIFSVFEEQDSLMKRTSDVEYLTEKKINPGEFNNPKYNNCRAYFFNSDTLFIDIGIGNGFGGQGFLIKYSKNKFYSEPYFSTDVIIPGEPEPTYRIVYQKLFLDKSSYKISDSLYGKIDFKSIENLKGKTIEHFGKGYFRTKVRKL